MKTTVPNQKAPNPMWTVRRMMNSSSTVSLPASARRPSDVLVSYSKRRGCRGSMAEAASPVGTFLTRDGGANTLPAAQQRWTRRDVCARWAAGYFRG